MKQYKMSTMVDYHHTDNVYKQLARKRRRVWVVWSLAISLMLIVGLVLFDGLRSKTRVSNANTPPAETLAASTELSVFNEPKFRLTADGSWRKVSNHEPGLTTFRYQSVLNDLVVRDITIYQDTIPDDFSLTHVLPVELDGNNLLPLTISPTCSTFQSNEKNKRDVHMSWAGADFICDPDLKAYIVGTSHNKLGYGIELTGNKTSGRYFFVFRDFTSVPQPERFNELLRSFQIK